MTHIRLPTDHPERAILADEVHARPPAPVVAPAAISCVALLGCPPGDSYARLQELAAAAGVTIPPNGTGHTIVDLPGVQIKWERHGEFVSFTFVQPLAGTSLAELTAFPSAFDSVPVEWLGSLPGQTIAAVDIALLPEGAPASEIGPVARWFDPNALAASIVFDGAARIFTDFVARGGEAATWPAGV